MKIKDNIDDELRKATKDLFILHAVALRATRPCMFYI